MLANRRNEVVDLLMEKTSGWSNVTAGNRKERTIRRSKQAASVRAAVVMALKYLALSGFSLFFIIPAWWMIMTSLKPIQEVFVYPPTLFPQRVMWSNYPEALRIIPFLLYLRNTLIITIPNVVGTLAASSLVAYGFSRIRWPGRNAVFVLVLSTMMLPYHVTMIPLYVLFIRGMNWGNTFYPLIIPGLFGSAFDIFLLRQFFMTIPMELSDAARMDGCSHLGIYRCIILPLAKPALATVGVFAFLDAWNSFVAPLLYLNRERLWTLALGLQAYRTTHAVSWNYMMAAGTVFTVPVIVLFFLAQRTFIQGIAMTGIKG